MASTDRMDQSYAKLQTSLDELIELWRASLARKRERHGEKFDHALATQDLYVRLHHISEEAVPALLAAAVDRLARMPDFVPNPEIADLDFDFDPEEGGEQ
jgi:hypothetical protein